MILIKDLEILKNVACLKKLQFLTRTYTTYKSCFTAQTSYCSQFNHLDEISILLLIACKPIALVFICIMNDIKSFIQPEALLIEQH